MTEKRKRVFKPRPNSRRPRTPITPGVMPEVDMLVRLIRAHGNTDEVQRRAGYDTKTLSSWAKGRWRPSLNAFIAMAAAVGYGIQLVPIDNMEAKPFEPKAKQ